MLTAGTRIGPHEIVAPLESEGVGEVYRARDTRLDRAVVIKVLSGHWSASPESRARFEREARIVAGLSHPGIRALHDIGRERPQPGSTPSAGSDASAMGPPVAVPEDQPSGTDASEIDFLVLEHLEGETVAARLARSSASGARKAQAFRVDEALAIGTQVAEALDKAHRTGLTHGDLKPASVFLVDTGSASDPPVAKLMDLGLSAVTGPSRAADAPAPEEAVLGAHPAAPPRAGVVVARSSDPANVSVLPTMAGGAAATSSTDDTPLEYKAPEQIDGRAADARTDIFAFGVLLYEMLTGRKAFEGKSRAVLMAAILTAEPDPLLALQPQASQALDHVIKRCLAKAPDDRWQTAHDLVIQLKWVSSISAKAGRPGAESTTARALRWLAAGAIVMGAALAGPLVGYLRGPDTVEPLQYRSPVVGLNTADISISPDGRLLAFMARPNTNEPSSLFVRPVGSVDSRRIAGTDDAALPFWSPDSRYIGFVAGGKLRMVDERGGAPRDIASAPAFTGGTWNRDGTILFGSPKGLFRVAAQGGTPEALTSLDKGEAGHFWPSFLPDGRHYLYLSWSAEPGGRAIYIGALDSKDRTQLMAAESNVVYAAGTGRAPGYLLYHREATVFARPFDASARSFVGDAVQVAGGVSYNLANGRGNFDVSQRDALLYFQGDAGGGVTAGRGQTVAQLQFGWVTRAGQVIGPAGVAGPYGDMDLSPNGRFVAVTRQDGGASDIWVIDWQRAAVASRLTYDPGDDLNPVWSSDSTRVAYTTYRKGNADIYVKNANGVGPETPLLESPNHEIIEAWSPDGRYIAYLFGAADNALDIYAMPLSGDRKPFHVVRDQFQKNEPQFSYDGKWLAYTSNETGMYQVYVVSFPSADKRLQVTTTGGGQPRWREDGRELFYRAPDNRIMAVDIKAGAEIEAGEPHVLFSPTVNAANTRDATRHQLAASRDGQRFVLRIPIVATGAQSGTAQAFTTFAPDAGQSGGRGQFFTGAARGGRGFAAGEAGLTVMHHWTASLPK